MEALPLEGGVGGVELLCVGCWLTENDEALRRIAAAELSVSQGTIH
jgi:hypothetical protein